MMEDKISFIPKKNLSPEPRGRRSGLGFFIAISALMFFLSGGLWGGLILYEKYLNDNNEQLNISLNKQKGSFETASVKEIVNLSQKINLADRLIKSHKAPSSIFNFLSGYTLKDVRFSSFDFSVSDDGAVSVGMSGLAKSYSDIALQSEAFKSVALVKSALFSDFNLDNKGMVRFAVKIDFDPSIINYKVGTE